MHQLHVLVGESDATIRSNIHEVLERDGRFSAVDDAADGDAAVAGAAHADAAVIDLAIAGLGCLATIYRIHCQPRAAAVVALAPTDDHRLINAARHAGAEDVLVWPRDRQLLADHVVEVGGRRFAEQ